MQSVIDHLGSQDFPRIRIGIGRPADGRDAADWVLSPFPPGEEPVILAAVERAAEAVGLAIRAGFPAAMNRYNGIG